MHLSFVSMYQMLREYSFAGIKMAPVSILCKIAKRFHNFYIFIAKKDDQYHLTRATCHIRISISHAKDKYYFFLKEKRI